MPSGCPGTMSAAAEQLVDRFVDDLRWEERLQQQPEVVEIATSPSSALCRTALMILDDLGIAYRELQIGRDVTEAQLVRRKGGPFVLLPLVFVDDRFVGGHSELKSLAALGADAVLSAGEPNSSTSFRGSSTPSPRTASPPIFDRLHYEAESNEARRAALQRHGLEYGLHSPMSPERAASAPPRPQSPQVKPRLSSPNRELVSQERSGVGIRAVIRTDRAGMRHDSVHSAVRCGGGWELRASTWSIETGGNAAQHRSRSPAYSPRRGRRRSPGRTPAAVRRPDPQPQPEPEPELQPEPQPQEDDAAARMQQRLQAVRNRLAELGSGIRLGTSSALGGDVALWGLDGDIITSTSPQTGKLPLLLRLLEGACDRVEKEDDSDGSARR